MILINRTFSLACIWIENYLHKAHKAQKEVLQFAQMDSSRKVEGEALHIDFLDDRISNSHTMNLRDDKGVCLDPESSKAEGLKVSANGHIVLVPQPSDNPQDPLNWNFAKKHAVLAVVIACSFLPDYGSVTGAATLAQQAE